MKQVILDTNFILTCVKQKIDFFNEIETAGMKILIPGQVIGELEGVVKSRKKLHFRDDAKLALKILGKKTYKEVKLEGEDIDDGISKFAENNPKIAVATLDRELKKKLKNQKMVIKGKKRLEIV